MKRKRSSKKRQSSKVGPTDHRSDPARIPIPDDWKEHPYQGRLPHFVYRFRPLSDKQGSFDNFETRLSFELGQSKVFLAGAHEQNDPEESSPDIRLIGSEAEIIKYLKDKLSSDSSNFDRLVQHVLSSGGYLPDTLLDLVFSVYSRQVRLASFTTNPLNSVMWSHYAGWQEGELVIPHGGVCIQYSCDENWRRVGLRPVEYHCYRAVINLLEGEAAVRRSFEDAAHRKSPDWSHEQEWRLVSYLGLPDPPDAELDPRNAVLGLEHSITALIFGLNTPASVKEYALAICKSRRPCVSVFQAVRDRLQLALRLEPVDV
jgi:hypothetical protein